MFGGEKSSLFTPSCLSPANGYIIVAIHYLCACKRASASCSIGLLNYVSIVHFLCVIQRGYSRFPLGSQTSDKYNFRSKTFGFIFHLHHDDLYGSF